MSASPLVPFPARLEASEPLSERERLFRLALPAPMSHRPGQFVMVSFPGVGEAPISIACAPRDDARLELTIRRVGSVTQALHALEPGRDLGLRGPYGNGIDTALLAGQDLVLVAGGLGLAPMRSLIQALLARREAFGRLILLAGFRTPAEALFRTEYPDWTAAGMEVHALVNRTEHQPWEGQEGLVTEPIPHLGLDPGRTLAVLVGPPVMYKFVVLELAACGLSSEHIFVDLERRMKCGIGKCGHCQIEDLYCCRQGPVFRLSDLETRREALA